MHKVLFTLAYFSNGGFTHTEIYNMPIYLRSFYLKQLEDTKTREAEALNAKPKRKGKGK